ncbi:MAG: hypothetical protein OXT74_00300 [Candidatus Poribacteria bacterium]|nr:hypothetical protein [Candidatus Poribacteria bacterium]
MSAIKKHRCSVVTAAIVSSFLFGIFTLDTSGESGETNADYNLPAPSSQIESYLRSITSSLRACLKSQSTTYLWDLYRTRYPLA